MDLDEQKQKWEDLPPGQRRGILTAGILTTLWQIWMLWDLWRRPADQVRGAKWAWVLASFVRPIGQIAYLARGRQQRA